MKRDVVNTAFEKTTPHALDSCVRIASPDDVVAIQHSDVRAVIVKGEMTPSIIVGLDSLPIAALNGIAYFSKRGVGGSPPPPSLPGALGQDARKTKALFRRAVDGATGVSTKIYDDDFAFWHFRKTPELQRLFNPDRRLEDGEYDGGNDTVTVRPHMDWGGIYRLVKTYSQHAQTGTIWFPGSYTREQERTVCKAFHKSADPYKFLQSLGAQTLEPGDTLLFKGENHHHHANAILLHASNLLHAGQKRGVLMLSAD